MSTAPTHPRALPPCDLVMKGGVTSGVVYPGAVMELSARYRFEKLGGTSAGAVAASMAAAAEYARQRSGSVQMVGVDEVVADLRRPGFVLSLFQPTAAARPLFDLVLRLLGAKGSRRRQSAALARAAIRHRPAPAAAALVGAILILVLLVAGFRHLPLALGVVLAALAAAVLMLLAAWAVLGPLVSVGRGVYRSLRGNGFGLCSGTAADASAPDALTEWLHARIQSCAQLPPEQPLTFAMLETAGVSLQMVATDLGLARPVTIPLAAEQYLFAPSELRALFPAPVVDHVLAVAGVPPAERDSSRTWFLPSKELPIVIGARLSSSVPLLLSSLKLYSANPDAFGPVESYMTDGGVTSNFPIHFFDNWLPSHPTFGLDLVSVGASAAQRDDAAVYMPADAQAPRLPTAENVLTLGGFLGRLQDASRNWRDELQAELPGFRDRVCQIRMRPGEGGFNLDADPAAVASLVERGHLAGQEILRTFDWDRHRFIRYLTLTALLRENFSLLADRFEKFRTWRSDQAPLVAAEDGPSQEALRAFERATVELMDRASALPPSSPWPSQPEPTMRVGPRV